MFINQFLTKKHVCIIRIYRFRKQNSYINNKKHLARTILFIYIELKIFNCVLNISLGVLNKRHSVRSMFYSDSNEIKHRRRKIHQTCKGHKYL